MERFFEKNREKIGGVLKDSSILVLFAGNAPKKRGDEKYPFSPDRNFYYSTGIDDENIIFMMCKQDGEIHETLFLERFDEIAAKWTGAVLEKPEAEKLSGVSDIKYIDEFEAFFSKTVFEKKIENLYLDLENRDFFCGTPSIKFAEKVGKAYPYVRIENIYNEFAQFRMIKEVFEKEKIKKAIDITNDGIQLMMKHAKAGMFEHEIEAYFDFAVKKGGASDKAFTSIAAGGKNAVVLHYSKNNSIVVDGDLILFDVGAQFEYYNADITRTFPVNGKFSDRQKQIYNIVLEGQKRVIDSIKPGVPFKKLNEILKEYYFEELKKIGLISDDGGIDEVSEYYYHGVSHMLGLETHDVGRHNEGVLAEGMVLTVEPGVYIENEGLGIRIEDDVIVTSDGCEVLSKDIIKTVEDIEAFMAGEKND